MNKHQVIWKLITCFPILSTLLTSFLFEIHITIGIIIPKRGKIKKQESNRSTLPGGKVGHKISIAYNLPSDRRYGKTQSGLCCSEAQL